MRALCTLLVLGLPAPQIAHSQTQVTLCELIRHPRDYDGKVVTFRATYKYGFEWQYLYCIDCLDGGKTWLEFSGDMDKASEKQLKRSPKDAGIVNLTVQGVLECCAGFGHLNGYRFQLTAQRISKVVVLSKGMKPPAQEQQIEKKCACGGTNPK